MVWLWNWVGPDDMKENVWNPRYFNFINNKRVYFLKYPVVRSAYSDYAFWSISDNNFSKCLFLTVIG